MCFWKTERSKVLRAKRDIVVYKIGDFADEDTFVPYFMHSSTYETDAQCRVYPNFKKDIITVGFHSYINILVATVSSYQSRAIIQKNNKQKSLIAIYPTFQETLYLGKFIIPKGAIYCVNDSNEIVSNKIIYTGQYADIRDISEINLKEFFNLI